MSAQPSTVAWAEPPCPADQMDLIHGLHEMDKFEPDYKSAKHYYEGTAAEFFATARLRRKLEPGSRRFRVNLAKTPVDVVVDALSIAAITVVDNPDAQAALEACFKDNEMEEEVPNLHRRTCEFGDSYLIIWPNDEDNTKVDIFFNDPRTVRVIYDEENPRLVDYAIKKFKQANTVRVNLLYRDRIEKWVRPASGADDKPSDWSHYLDDDMDDDYDDMDGDGEPVGAPIWPIPNPYGVVPVFHFRTQRPYGVPVHKDAYGPQDAVNKLIVSQMSTVDYATFPQRYALTENGVDTDESADFWDDDKDATIRTGDVSSLKSGAGELWYLQGVKSVGDFAVAPSAAYLDPLSMHVKLMAQTTDTPLHRFEPGGQQPSGESLKVANMPLNKKVKAFQRSFGGTWNKALTFALTLLGYENVTIDLRWENPNTVDDADSWAVTSSKIAAGVPLRQALLEAGYTKDQLDEWHIPELGAVSTLSMADRARSIMEIGKAAQALGAAVGFGVVDPAQAKAIVDRFLMDDSPPVDVVVG